MLDLATSVSTRDSGLMAELDSWTFREFHHDGVGRPTYWRGSGRGVIVIHEAPGMTPKVIEFAEDIVQSGFTVVMPSLFGTPGRPPTAIYSVRSIGRACISREFSTWRLNRTSPIIDWLRALARQLQTETGHQGVGAVGMCFTGGFALGMMVDEAVTAPVLAQPSLPFPIGRKRAADLGLSPADTDAVVARCAAGSRVLGVHYEKDLATGTRFDRLDQLLGPGFIRVDLPGRKHSTLTEHRDEGAVERVISFLRTGS